MMFLVGRNVVVIRFLLRFIILVLLNLQVFFSVNVRAITFDYGFSQSIESSSNILLVPEVLDNGEYEDTTNISTIYLRVNEDSADFKGFVDLNVNYIDFEKNVASDVTRNHLNSDFLWTITPGHYSWLLNDSYTQTRTDPSLLFNESNTQNVNVLGTGPRFEWKVQDNVIYLDSYVYNYNYSVTDNDSTNIVSSLRWSKKMPSGMKMSLNVSTTIVSYDNPDEFTDYDKSSTGVSFQYIREINSFDIFYGKTFLNSDDVSRNEFSNSNILFSRKLSRFSKVDITYINGLSDQNDAIDTGGTVLSGVFVNKRSAISYQRESSGLGLNINVFDGERKSSDTGYLDAQKGSEISITRALSPRSRIQISYSDAQSKVNGGVEYDDDTYNKRLEYIKRFNNRFSLKMFVSELFVKSSDVLRQYTDKRVGITFSISR